MEKNIGKGLCLILAASLYIGCGGDETLDTKTDAAIDSALFIADTKTAERDVADSSSGATKPLAQFSNTEKKALCDQVAENQGGYGRTAQCDDGDQVTDTDQASCVSGISTIASLCPDLTSNDLINCSEATGPDLCKFATVDECKAVYNCLG